MTSRGGFEGARVTGAERLYNNKYGRLCGDFYLFVGVLCGFRFKGVDKEKRAWVRVVVWLSRVVFSMGPFVGCRWK